MKTIQMTLDENLIKKVDKEVNKQKTSRSAFTREALKQLLKYYHTMELEKKQQKGYQKHPPSKNEFAVWEDEQSWIE